MKYRVYDEDGDASSAIEIEATSMDDAAESFREQDDFDWENDDVKDVWVQDPETGNWVEFEVRREYDPIYTAYEKDET